MCPLYAETIDDDKKKIIEESIKKICAGKGTAAKIKALGQSIQSSETVAHASQAAKSAMSAVKVVSSDAIEAGKKFAKDIPESYFDAVKELIADPFKGIVGIGNFELFVVISIFGQFVTIMVVEASLTPCYLRKFHLVWQRLRLDSEAIL